MRRYGLLHVLIACALAFGCQTPVPPDIRVLHEPRFTSFSADYPPPREHYPRLIAAGRSTVTWGEPAGETISGYDLMFALDGTPPDGTRLVQYVLKVPSDRRGCTGPYAPAGATAIEYFGLPAYDHQAGFFPAESARIEPSRGWAAFVTLPGHPPEIPEGENAAGLGAEYLRSISADARQQLIDRVIDQAVIEWAMDYEYDACHGRDQPQTTCRQLHCLRLWYRARPDASQPFGEWRTWPTDTR